MKASEKILLKRLVESYGKTHVLSTIKNLDKGIGYQISSSDVIDYIKTHLFFSQWTITPEDMDYLMLGEVYYEFRHFDTYDKIEIVDDKIIIYIDLNDVDSDVMRDWSVPELEEWLGIAESVNLALCKLPGEMSNNSELLKGVQDFLRYCSVEVYGLFDGEKVRLNNVGWITSDYVESGREGITEEDIDVDGGEYDLEANDINAPHGTEDGFGMFYADDLSDLYQQMR